MKPVRALLPGAAFLLSCLQDHPMIDADRVYDPETAIRQSRFSGLDSLDILLVDAKDSTRQLPLWSSRPDDMRNLPVHVAKPEERFYFLLRGYQRGKGHCYSETIRDRSSTVTLNTCLPRPIRFRPARRLLDFGHAESRLHLEIEKDSGFIGGVGCLSTQGWIHVAPRCVEIDRKRPGDDVQVDIDRSALAPGAYAGWILFRIGESPVDSVEVRANSDSIDIFGRDTLEMSGRQAKHSLAIRVPYTSNANWLGKPSQPWIQTGLEAGFVGIKQGGVANLIITLDREAIRRKIGKNPAFLYAYGSDSRPMDSLGLSVSINHTVRLHGEVREWMSDSCLAGVTVALDDGKDSALTDSSGRFTFDFMDIGTHTFEVRRTGDIGRVWNRSFDPRDTSVSFVLRIPGSPPAFKPISANWNPGRICDVAIVANQVVIPGMSAGSGEGTVLCFPDQVLDPAGRRLIPMGNLSSGPAPRALDAMEITGDSMNLFLVYPTDTALGMISDWLTPEPQSRHFRLPFLPFGMAKMNQFESQKDPPPLFIAGRTSNSQVVVAKYWKNAGAWTLKADTVKSLVCDGAEYPYRGPILVAYGNGSLIVSDGQAPHRPSTLALMAEGNHSDFRAFSLEARGVNDMVLHMGRLYVASQNHPRQEIQIIDNIVAHAPYTPKIISAGSPTRRIVFGEDMLGEYGFVGTDSDTILVVHILSQTPVGKMVLPGGLPAKSMAVNRISRKAGPNTEHWVYATDGKQIYHAVFSAKVYERGSR